MNMTRCLSPAHLNYSLAHGRPNLVPSSRQHKNPPRAPAGDPGPRPLVSRSQSGIRAAHRRGSRLASTHRLLPSTWAGITPEGPAGELENELKIVGGDFKVPRTPFDTIGAGMVTS